MNRDYYYFREVFLGLREEYLKNKEELENLKKYIICCDKRVDDFYLRLFKNSKEEVMLWITSQEKNKELYNFFRMLFGSYYIGYDDSLVLKNDDTNNFKLINNKYKLSFNKNYIEQFHKEYDRIMESDFVKNMYLVINSKEKNLWLTLSRITLALEKGNFTYYSSYNEEIEVMNDLRNKKITTDYMRELFDTKIEKNHFSKYHQDIIEANRKSLKELQFSEELFGKEYADIILEEKDGIVLCKKRKKHN